MNTRMASLCKVVFCTGLGLGLSSCGGGYGGGGMAAGYTVGGTVTGLTGTGLVLLDNGTDSKTINTNGAFTFAVPLSYGMTHNVTVKTEPATPAQTCTVTSGSGTVGYTNITNISVTCV